MHIAIGTTDGTAVCDHLAHSAAFIVFEIQDGRAVSKSVRDRRQGACGNHASFVEMLAGCQAVLCGGIGQGAYDSLRANGIESVVLASRHSVDEAIALYLEGKLATTNERVCLCH